MKTALLLYSHTEKPRRDGLGGPCIAVTYEGTATTHEGQFPLLLEKLRHPETIQHIVDESCLVTDRFEGDESYVFEKVEHRDFGIVYTFKNSESEECEVWFAMETITVV
jgi:hypothetical protein